MQELKVKFFSLHAVTAYGGNRGRPIDRLIVDFDPRWMFVLRFALLGRPLPRVKALRAQ
jgi:hypothetical protein